jgi:hypothetical protein
MNKLIHTLMASLLLVTLVFRDEQIRAPHQFTKNLLTFAESTKALVDGQ